jgi:DNA-binding transcriptional ArsR family regulator
VPDRQLPPASARNRPAPITTATVGTPLDQVFGALSDPIRRGIVERLARGPCTVTQLGAPFDVSAPAISKHLGVLEGCGLIVRWKVGRVHHCRLIAAPLVDAAAWIERHRAFWSHQLDALGEYLDREDEACEPAPKTGEPE